MELMCTGLIQDVFHGAGFVLPSLGTLAGARFSHRMADPDGALFRSGVCAPIQDCAPTVTDPVERASELVVAGSCVSIAHYVDPGGRIEPGTVRVSLLVATNPALGFVIEYRDGTPCQAESNERHRRTSIEVRCDPSVPGIRVLSVEEGKGLSRCFYAARIATSQACAFPMRELGVRPDMFPAADATPEAQAQPPRPSSASSTSGDSPSSDALHRQFGAHTAPSSPSSSTTSPSSSSLHPSSSSHRPPSSPPSASPALDDRGYEALLDLVAARLSERDPVVPAKPHTIRTLPGQDLLRRGVSFHGIIGCARVPPALVEAEQQQLRPSDPTSASSPSSSSSSSSSASPSSPDFEGRPSPPGPFEDMSWERLAWSTDPHERPAQFWNHGIAAAAPAPGSPSAAASSASAEPPAPLTLGSIEACASGESERIFLSATIPTDLVPIAVRVGGQTCQRLRVWRPGHSEHSAFLATRSTVAGDAPYLSPAVTLLACDLAPSFGFRRRVRVTLVDRQNLNAVRPIYEAASSSSSSSTSSSSSSTSSSSTSSSSTSSSSPLALNELHYMLHDTVSFVFPFNPLSFDPVEDLGVGGIDREVHELFRRLFTTRLVGARQRQQLGVSHVRGAILYGPPGTGKTLLARRIASVLRSASVTLVLGPELLSKFVGQSEANVRSLFAPAEKEAALAARERRPAALHVIIVDEMDALFSARSGMGSGGSGGGPGGAGGGEGSAAQHVYDGVVDQLLSKMDGLRVVDNVLVLGLTNRRDVLDPALLRPGRFEVQVRLGYPSSAGRRDILRVATRALRLARAMAEDVDLDAIARLTDGFSGADLAGLVRDATARSMARAMDRHLSSVRAGSRGHPPRTLDADAADPSLTSRTTEPGSAAVAPQSKVTMADFLAAAKTLAFLPRERRAAEDPLGESWTLAQLAHAFLRGGFLPISDLVEPLREAARAIEARWRLPSHSLLPGFASPFLRARQRDAFVNADSASTVDGAASLRAAALAHWTEEASTAELVLSTSLQPRRGAGATATTPTADNRPPESPPSSSSSSSSFSSSTSLFLEGEGTDFVATSVLVHGPRGSGKSAVAAMLARMGALVDVRHELARWRVAVRRRSALLGVGVSPTSRTSAAAGSTAGRPVLDPTLLPSELTSRLASVRPPRTATSNTASSASASTSASARAGVFALEALGDPWDGLALSDAVQVTTVTAEQLLSITSTNGRVAALEETLRRARRRALEDDAFDEDDAEGDEQEEVEEEGEEEEESGRHGADKDRTHGASSFLQEGVVREGSGRDASWGEAEVLRHLRSPRNLCTAAAGFVALRDVSSAKTNRAPPSRTGARSSTTAASSGSVVSSGPPTLWRTHVVVLDDIERLLEFVGTGPREATGSLSLLHLVRSWLDGLRHVPPPSPPPPSPPAASAPFRSSGSSAGVKSGPRVPVCTVRRRLLVVATTSAADLLRNLGLWSSFDVHVETHLLSARGTNDALALLGVVPAATPLPRFPTNAPNPSSPAADSSPPTTFPLGRGWRANVRDLVEIARFVHEMPNIPETVTLDSRGVSASTKRPPRARASESSDGDPWVLAEMLWDAGVAPDEGGDGGGRGGASAIVGPVWHTTGAHGRPFVSIGLEAMGEVLRRFGFDSRLAPQNADEGEDELGEDDEGEGAEDGSRSGSVRIVSRVRGEGTGTEGASGPSGGRRRRRRP